MGDASPPGQALIGKAVPSGSVAPNLQDYTKVYADFTWADAAARLCGMSDGKLNIAFEAIDRHVGNGLGDKVAIRWIGREGARRDITYGELAEESGRFAAALQRLGIGPGETVFSLLGRIPELYVAALGTLKNGSVFCPLFSAFGPDPIRSRMSIGEAKVLVTNTRLYSRKVEAGRGDLPQLRHVLLVDGGESLPPETHSLQALLKEVPPAETKAMDPEAPALLHFTSGTTGKPKGALHVHAAVIAHHVTGFYALDFHANDTYWCTADPGWVTGTSYGIVSPLTNGVTTIVDEAEFDAVRWYRILSEQKVTVWYTAPTAIRMLMKVGGELARQHDLSALRFMASVGEPLNAEAVVWSNEVFGRPFHDNWWQTETGGIMIANYASLPVKPGSMGRPLPGIEAAVVTRDDHGHVEKISDAMQPGELALRAGWPSMFRGYLHERERYAKCFADGWYLTGDIAAIDRDGYFWFVGRADDMIKSSGHLIGPFEVESALMEHPAVAEAGVIGMPDELAGEAVVAYVSLRAGYVDSPRFRKDLMAHARRRLGPAVAPREIEVRTSLPKTRSGKIMRRLLKAEALGLPIGDTSTLEGGDDDR